MKDSFVFYRSFYEAIKDLTIEEQSILFNAICELALNETDTELTGIPNTLFKLIKPQIEANNERYNNGKKGGRPSKKTIGSKKEKTIGFENKKPNVNVNENVNVNVNNKKENIKRKYFEDKELNDLFLEYLEMRKKLKAVNSDRAINLLINKLNQFDDVIKKQMINNSIENSWKSIYPLKETKSKMTIDEMKAQIDWGSIDD